MTDDDPWAKFPDAVPAAPPSSGEDPWARFPDSGTTSPPSPPSPPDKYKQAAIDLRNKVIATGGQPLEGYDRRIAQGAGLGWTDEFLAAATTPIEMARHGTWSPAEGYRYAKAISDLELEKTREKTAGPLGAAAEFAGGATSGGGLLARGAPVFAGRAGMAAKPLLNYAANIPKGIGFGALVGAGDAPTAADIPAGAAMGGVLGGTVAAVVPPLIMSTGALVRPLFNPLRNPQRVATEQVAKVSRDANVSPAELVQEISDAHAAGQPYTVADVLGKEGQRKLTAMAKVPGPQRDRITDVLTARNLNMPERTGGEVGTALGAPTTAEAASTALVERAGREAAPVYRAAERIPTWSDRLQPFLDDPIARQGLAHGVQLQRLRSVGTDRPFNPTDAMMRIDENGMPVVVGVPNMQTLHTLKVGLDRMVENNINPVTGNLTAEGNAIAGFRNRMLAEIDQINPTYARARQIYGGPMQVAEGIRTGSQMPTRGRSADTMAAFREAPQDVQGGIRIGYADKVRGDLERTGNIPTILREKSTKGRNELEGLSLYQGPRAPDRPDQLRRFLNREEEMQRTSKAALGGSSTAENVADIAAAPGGLPEAMGLASAAARGNPMGMVRNAYELASRHLRGETEKQRNAITDALLTSGPAEAQALADRIADFNRHLRNPFARPAP